jgi:hypothetical protein
MAKLEGDEEKLLEGCSSIRSKVRCQFPRDHIGPHLAEIDEVTVLMWEKF